MINSKQYWEDRFKTGDWKNNSGDKQTEFFYRLVLDLLPDWLIEEIQREEYSILDAGCAEGEGAFLLKNKFINSSVKGVDFSESAIEKACKLYPTCSFEAMDLFSLSEKYDIVLSSNVVEHFLDPRAVIEKLISISNKYCILMLPFREKDLIEEHFHSFDFSSFNLKIDNFQLLYYQTIDSSKIEGTQWYGEQILLVYTLSENSGYLKYKLSHMDNKNYDVLLCTQNQLMKTESDLHQLEREFSAKKIEFEKEKSGLEEGLRNILKQEEDTKRELTLYMEKLGIVEHSLEAVSKKLEKTLLELRTKETELMNKQGELETKNQELETKNQELFISLEERSALLNKYQQLSSVVDLADYESDQIMRTTSMRALHLLQRIKSQLLFGSFEEKKKFFQWLSQRKRLGSNDHRFNPVYNIKSILAQKNQINMGGEVSGTVESVFLKHFNHVKDYSEYALKRVQTASSKKISTLIEKWEGNILVYPHVLRWEPLQTPQQIIKAFAEKGWLCFFCESQIGDEFDKVEDNVYLVSETALLQAIGETHVHVMLTWMVSVAWMKNIKNKTVWYHILDQIDIFSYYDSEYEKFHNKILLEADFVSYVAKPLEKYTKETRKDAIYLPNAVNPKDFLNIHNNYVPSDMKDILSKGKKVIGYYGYVSEWFNLDWIHDIAVRKKEYEFVIIGPYTVDISRFETLDNVSFLGLKPYKELSDYAKFFDIAIIPFLINEMMDCVSPIKFYEYCALGKPVITSYMKEMEQYENEYIKCVHTANEFEKAIRELLEESIQKKAKAEAFYIAEQNTWISRVDIMIDKFLEV